MIRTSIFVALIMGVFTHCKNAGRTAAIEVNSDSLQIQFNALNDSLRVSWDEMTASDDEKIGAVGQLLQSISRSCKPDQILYDSVARQQQSLPAKRYLSPDAITSDQIDRYDASTDSLLNGVRVLYEKTDARVCCTGCDSVLNRIEQLHGQVVMYRIRYDGHGRQHNALLSQQKENLTRLNPEYDKLKPKQLFSLMQ